MSQKQEKTQDFETLIELSKSALKELNDQFLTLKESLEIYKNGLQSLEQAQKLLEEAKLEYSTLNPQTQETKEQ